MAKYPVKHHPTAKKTECLHLLKFRFASELNMESIFMKIRTNLQPRPQNLLQYTDFVLFQFQVPTFRGIPNSVNTFKKTRSYQDHLGFTKISGSGSVHHSLEKCQIEGVREDIPGCSQMLPGYSQESYHLKKGGNLHLSRWKFHVRLSGSKWWEKTTQLKRLWVKNGSSSPNK